MSEKFITSDAMKRFFGCMKEKLWESYSQFGNLKPEEIDRLVQHEIYKSYLMMQNLRGFPNWIDFPGYEDFVKGDEALSREFVSFLRPLNWGIAEEIMRLCRVYGIYFVLSPEDVTLCSSGV